MKFQCNRQKLNKAVENLQRVTASKTTIPALEGILLRAEKNKLTLCGYDLDIGITTSIDANIKTERINSNNKKKHENHLLKTISLSPHNQNIYNKKTNNNKIINININNILKIKKQYSLSFAKSNDGSSKINHFINYGFSKDKNENKIKNNNHSVPLSLKKQTNKDKKKAIKQFRKNVFKDIKNDINNKKINFDLKHNKKYSSLLKKYLLAE